MPYVIDLDGPDDGHHEALTPDERRALLARGCTILEDDAILVPHPRPPLTDEKRQARDDASDFARFPLPWTLRPGREEDDD